MGSATLAAAGATWYPGGVIVLWLAAVVGGFGLALIASQRAVGHARVLIEASRIPPFFVGVTLFAIGTDLPEIANSIVASLSDHGDLNVGDSVGSAATQVTLVLGLLPLLVAPFVAGRRRMGRAGEASIVALLLVALLASDGQLSRVDAALLVSAWLAGSVVIWRGMPPAAEPAMRVPATRPWRHGLAALLMLAGVGAGAGAAVWGLVSIAAEFDVPEFALAFFGAAIGTSLPELVVDVTALRAGARDLALGDILGSTFVDATLSVGIGPLIAPTAVTAGLAVRGSLAAAAAVAVAVTLLSIRRRHDRVSGVALILVWLALYAVVLG